MHQYLVCKVLADTAEDAIDAARSCLEESIEESNNTVGWDYVSEELKIVNFKEYGCSTAKEFELKMVELRQTSIEDAIDSVRRELLNEPAV